MFKSLETLIREALGDAGGATIYLSDARARYVVGGLKSWDAPAGYVGTVAAITNASRQLSDTPAEAQAIGSWLDRDDHRVYLDYSSLHDGLEEALSTARARNELAIFDTVSGETIRA